MNTCLVHTTYIPITSLASHLVGCSIQLTHTVRPASAKGYRNWVIFCWGHTLGKHVPTVMPVGTPNPKEA